MICDKDGSTLQSVSLKTLSNTPQEAYRCPKRGRIQLKEVIESGMQDTKEAR